MALVAERVHPKSGEKSIVAVARIIRKHRENAAEFGIVLSDAFQHQGLGSALLARLFEVAQKEGIDRVVADVLPENVAMCKLCAKLGVQLTFNHTDGVLKAVIDLRSNT